eukprot:Amastigsp_a509091_361.p4 type:complete len:141 gc:universal Amastigsp_a509091_361:1134-1556(+)
MRPARSLLMSASSPMSILLVRPRQRFSPPSRPLPPSVTSPSLALWRLPPSLLPRTCPRTLASVAAAVAAAAVTPLRLRRRLQSSVPLWSTSKPSGSRRCAPRLTRCSSFASWSSRLRRRGRPRRAAEAAVTPTPRPRSRT